MMITARATDETMNQFLSTSTASLKLIAEKTKADSKRLKKTDRGKAQYLFGFWMRIVNELHRREHVRCYHLSRKGYQLN